ncbi:MAG: carbonic anhydrase [Candidatus Gastranaerophilales bacterium]
MIKNMILVMSILFTSLSVRANVVENLSADDALAKLKKGNSHFVEAKMEHPHENKEWIEMIAKGQHPFVAILSCSDSRVSPEVIFDQGMGDIFEIRNAGNVLDEHVVGSIEYAVYHLGVKLVVIMGHQDCGVIHAALSGQKESKYIESLKNSVIPIIVKYDTDDVNELAKILVKEDIKELLEDDSNLKDFIIENDVKIIPAYYHVDSGIVDWL